MDVGQLVWLFFILSALQPALQQKLLQASRQRLLALLERRRKTRVILLVHRQETMNFLGFPVMRYIDIDDSEAVMRAVELTDSDVPIDLMLHTPGGLVLAATQIARAIRNHKAWVTVFVPHYAMSGGTLIGLAADAIVMSRHAASGAEIEGPAFAGDFPRSPRILRDRDRRRCMAVERDAKLIKGELPRGDLPSGGR